MLCNPGAAVTPIYRDVHGSYSSMATTTNGLSSFLRRAPYMEGAVGLVLLSQGASKAVPSILLPPIGCPA